MAQCGTCSGCSIYVQLMNEISNIVAKHNFKYVCAHSNYAIMVSSKSVYAKLTGWNDS